MSRAKLEALIDSAMQQIKTALLNELDEVVKSMKKDEFKRQRSVQLLNSQECQAVIDIFQSKKLQKLAYVQNRLLNVG